MLNYFLLALAVLTHGADCWTTVKGISLGLTEKNPVAVFVSHIFRGVLGDYWTIMLKIPMFLWLGYGFVYFPQAIQLSAATSGVALLGAAIAYHNYKLIKQKDIP